MYQKILYVIAAALLIAMAAQSAAQAQVPKPTPDITDFELFALEGAVFGHTVKHECDERTEFGGITVYSCEKRRVKCVSPSRVWHRTVAVCPYSFELVPIIPGARFPHKRCHGADYFQKYLRGKRHEPTFKRLYPHDPTKDDVICVLKDGA